MSREIHKFRLSNEDVKLITYYYDLCERLRDYFGANSQAFNDGKTVLTEIWRRLAWSYGFHHTNATLKGNVLSAIGDALEWDETNKIWA